MTFGELGLEIILFSQTRLSLSLNKMISLNYPVGKEQDPYLLHQVYKTTVVNTSLFKTSRSD